MNSQEIVTIGSIDGPGPHIQEDGSIRIDSYYFMDHHPVHFTAIKTVKLNIHSQKCGNLEVIVYPGLWRIFDCQNSKGNWEVRIQRLR